MARTDGAVSLATRRRTIRQEELRDKMQGLEYINQLHQIDEELKEGKVDRERLEILKVRIDLNFKRLKKILPDEQYIQIEGMIDATIGVRKIVVEGVKAQNT